MSNRRLLFDFGWKLSKDYDFYACPVCQKRNCMVVDLSDSQDIRFYCKEGCSHEQILSALGQDPSAVYTLGAPTAAKVEVNSDEQGLPLEVAQQWLDMCAVSSFPDYVQKSKRENNGVIPVLFEGMSMSELADAFGYRITTDRRNIYQIPSISTSLDLMQKKLSPPPFVVAGLLPAGLCIFSAPSKTGKSWMALDLCNSVANGFPFMGRSVNQGDVLYLDLEDSEYVLQARMRKIQCTETKSFHYAFTAPRLGAGMTEFLAAWHDAAEKPRLIVIDVLQRVKPAGKSNRTAYEQDYDLYAPLNAFALEKGIAIVAITHNRKSNGLTGDDYDSISGSVGQMGAAQTAWLITGKRGQTEEKTLRATGRDIREVEDLIIFNPDKCRWENHGDAEEAAEKKAKDSYSASPIRKTLIELLEEDGTHTWIGTYEDLFFEIANRTGLYPFSTANELQKGIRPLEILLSQNDGILHKKLTNRMNGRYGYHKWYRQNLMGE